MEDEKSKERPEMRNCSACSASAGVKVVGLWLCSECGGFTCPTCRMPGTSKCRACGWSGAA